MVDAPTLLPEGRPDDKTRLGYIMVATAATLFAVNGSVSKVVLGSGLSSLELAQIRNTCAAILFLAFLLVVAPSRLRVGRRELLFLVAFGLVGIALVQWLYFVAIENLPVGVALLIEFTAPLFVALFARFVYKEHVRRRIWVAVAMCLTGLALVVELWAGVAFSTVGVTAAFGGALALTAYLLMAERERQHRDAASLSFYGFLFAALLWAVVQPLWDFPWGVLDDEVSLQGNLSEHSAPVWALVTFIVVIGTMVTFSLLTGSLRHISRDTRVDRGDARARRRHRRRVGMARRDLRPDAAHRRRRRHRRHPRRPVGALTYPVLMVERVLLASPRGYCAGVERAVETVERALEHYGAPVYVRKQIVHNIHVVRDLEARGAIFVEEETEVPEGATVVYSAHGVAPSVFANSAKLGHNVIDAVCPLVTKVHVQARRYADEGYTVVLIGHEGHEEVVGTMGEAPDATVLVQTVEEAEALDLPADAKLAYVTQTTLSVDETGEIITALRRRFPEIRAPRKEDICYATSNRQWAVKEMLPEIDLLLVIGSRNSSNSNRLVETSRAAGTPAHLIDDETEIDEAWLEGARTVGITSGASAPEKLVSRVCDWFRARGVTDIEPYRLVEEDVTFRLPVELRRELELARQS